MRRRADSVVSMHDRSTNGGSIGRPHVAGRCRGEKGGRSTGACERVTMFCSYCCAKRCDAGGRSTNTFFVLDLCAEAEAASSVRSSSGGDMIKLSCCGSWYSSLVGTGVVAKLLLFNSTQSRHRQSAFALRASILCSVAVTIPGAIGRAGDLCNCTAEALFPRRGLANIFVFCPLLSQTLLDLFFSSPLDTDDEAEEKRHYLVLIWSRYIEHFQSRV